MLDIQESSSQSIEGGDPVAQIRLGIAGLAAEDRDSWIGISKSQRVQELLEVRERFDAEILRAIASWDRDRAWEIDGSLSPRAWLTHRTLVADGEAQRLVKNARLVSENPEISAALGEGELTVPHVEAIGRVA